MDDSTWRSVLLAALAAHAGFQLTVTLVVYPALADVPVAAWRTAHAAHSRRITPVVVVVYAAALAACLGALLHGPSAATWLAVAATLVAVGVTATLAGPLHGRLEPRDEVLLRRLLVVDRVRCVAAVTALVAVVAAVAQR